VTARERLYDVPGSLELRCELLYGGHDIALWRGEFRGSIQGATYIIEAGPAPTPEAACEQIIERLIALGVVVA
jgi:hypothetical protein